MAADQLGLADVELDRRREAAQEVEPVVTELLTRPARRVEQALATLLVLDRLGAEIERDEEVVGVAVHTRTTELAQDVDTLARLRPALCDIAERDDQVDIFAPDVLEDGAEGDGIAVHVRDEGDAH